LSLEVNLKPGLEDSGHIVGIDHPRRSSGNRLARTPVLALEKCGDSSRSLLEKRNLGSSLQRKHEEAKKAKEFHRPILLPFSRGTCQPSRAKWRAVVRAGRFDSFNAVSYTQAFLWEEVK
jgi:hypothetical protein